ncbi:helix-turn-helix domain-containing protein [Arthrobacter sp. BL-252-APC-1A]|uniref:helix-turn-helix domain-containing protein n=1 Tax=Arthrobacter sp. BL-252-APC-1A TaxID=2606622 RepID=UPI0012B28C65|nr:helix-turn-helix domain-containing protein [Arthrobacter sp. BL-252-APC-1A]MSR99908.1 helix-turn-helix domain-containing protein [Arthrobacter sp. BL-252-APC-1A]
MSQQSRTTPALTGKDAKALDRALSAGDVTVFVDGTALRLPPAARDAVLDLLGRLATGKAVTVSSTAEEAVERDSEARGHNPLLTTSQAAAAAGISHTYLRNLTDAGVIPVEYRGTHRRIRMSDVEAWLQSQREQRAAKAARGGDGKPGGTDT